MDVSANTSEINEDCMAILPNNSLYDENLFVKILHVVEYRSALVRFSTSFGGKSKINFIYSFILSYFELYISLIWYFCDSADVEPNVMVDIL